MSDTVLPDEQRLAALAEFAAGAGHEINNPVAVICGWAEHLLRDEPDPERRQRLATIGAQARRIRDMIGDLMLFARPPQPERVPFDLAEVVREVVRTFREDAPTGVHVELTSDEHVRVIADPTQCRVVVECLLRNSMEAVDETGGHIGIDTRERGPWVQLTVRDDGRGLSEQDLRHLFDPFYSGRQAGRGLGFGLCKCWRILQLHGGRIEVESDPDGPTTFRALWPAGPDDPPERLR